MNQKNICPLIAILTAGLLALLIYSIYSTNIRLDALETSLQQHVTFSRKPVIPTPKVSKITPTSIQNTNISFDLNKISPGDRVGPMTAVTVVSKSGAAVQFKGKIIVTGKYTVDDGQGMMPPGIVCFQEFDQTSLDKLPKEINDTRNVWFCLNDKPELKTLFTKNTGTATIEIDNYFVNLLQAGVFNTADLIKLISSN